MNTFCIFLRGINVGGNKKVPMAELRTALEAVGYTNVQTLLNSGNVIIKTPQQLPNVHTEVTQLLQDTFGFSVPVIIRTNDQIRTLLHAQPFAHIKCTKETRLYVSFGGNLLTMAPWPLPHNVSEGFTIVTQSETEVCSMLTIMPNINSTTAMKILEQTYGKNITTRNWNTIEKIGAKL